MHYRKEVHREKGQIHEWTDGQHTINGEEVHAYYNGKALTRYKPINHHPSQPTLLHITAIDIANRTVTGTVMIGEKAIRSRTVNCTDDSLIPFRLHGIRIPWHNLLDHISIGDHILQTTDHLNTKIELP